MKLTLKQKRFADEYIIRNRILAAKELAKRYLNIGMLVSEELENECINCIRSDASSGIQKYAAKTVLQFKHGVQKTNDLVESFAIVKDRSDRLVARWAAAVKKRDGACVLCGDRERLAAHHISHWADDPINRIKIDNGITLCAECHSKQHPELSERLFLK